MFIHRENALKAHQHIILITLKKTILMQNFNQNIYQDTSNCAFFQNFLAA